MEHVIKMGKVIFGLIIATVHGHSQFNKSVIFIRVFDLWKLRLTYISPIMIA